MEEKQQNMCVIKMSAWLVLIDIGSDIDISSSL